MLLKTGEAADSINGIVKRMAIKIVCDICSVRVFILTSFVSIFYYDSYKSCAKILFDALKALSIKGFRVLCFSKNAKAECAFDMNLIYDYIELIWKKTFEPQKKPLRRGGTFERAGNVD